MSSPAFTLQVSADSQFRTLLAEVTSRYVELMGGTAAECATVADALAEQVETVPRNSHALIEVTCTPRADGLDVSIRSDGHATVLHHPRPAAKS
jgi:hypothetical protein